MDEGETTVGSCAEEAVPSGKLKAICESVLFAASEPVTVNRLSEILRGASRPAVVAALAELRRDYEDANRGIRLVEVAGGYQLRTDPENAVWVRALLRDRPARLARPTLETLAIVAYRQPIARAEIEAIRGVDVEGVLGTLLARRLIRVAGRREGPGRPILYGTTPEFLEAFGLRDLTQLPVLRELSEIRLIHAKTIDLRPGTEPARPSCEAEGEP